MNSYNTHSHQLKCLVVEAGDPHLFKNLGVKPNTAKKWLQYDLKVPIDVTKKVRAEAVDKRVIAMARELAETRALIKLYGAINEVICISLRRKNIGCSASRKKILEALDEASVHVKIRTILPFIGVSKSRYKEWRAQRKNCENSPGQSCSVRYSNQLTAEEISKMKELITSKKNAHMPISSIHEKAKRDGELFCNLGTWYRYNRKFSWSRPFSKVKKGRDPERVKRGELPNQILHIDISEIRLVSGTKYYLQTLMDSYSRYVLGWHLSNSKTGLETSKLIETALANLRDSGALVPDKARIVSDRGKENLNGFVDHILRDSGYLHRLHKVDVRYSNNLLEVLFRSLKNNYLYHLPPQTKNQLFRRLKFYFSQHNDFVPLRSIAGHIPKELYFGEEVSHIFDKIEVLQETAITERKIHNKSNSCAICPSKKGS